MFVKQTGKSLSYRKKLIEVSLPLDAINAASAREKSIRHGHPSTLHLWWARRPLAACRAVLFAQLVDDPSSCPEEFPTIEEQDHERDRLHGIIEAMVPWEASTNETILHAARYEIARSVVRNGGPAVPADWKSQAHAAKVIDYLQQHAPPVHDPFSGGGSIPLEAQRLGLRARGSDLNPVAVLIGKALVEFPPKFAGLAPINPEADRHKSWKGVQGLAEDVRYYGRWMRDEAKKRIGHLYPKAKLSSGGEATVIAWLWARTVPSPDPRAMGAHVPLASSFLLAARKGKEAIAVPVVDREANTWHFEVNDNPTSQELIAAKNGTKAARGANFTCILTGSVIDDAHVKAAAKAGQMSQRLMAVVAEGERGRVYISPTYDQEALALGILQPDVSEIEQPVPARLTGGTCYGYGLTTFDKLFTTRQLIALTTFSDLISATRDRVLDEAKQRWQHSESDGVNPFWGKSPVPIMYADAVAVYLAFALNKMVDRQSTICTWDAGAVGKASTGAPGRSASIRNTFSRQAIPMSWDFAEANAFSESAANFEDALGWVVKPIEYGMIPAVGEGKVWLADAAKNGYAERTVFSTDPPSTII